MRAFEVGDFEGRLDSAIVQFEDSKKCNNWRRGSIPFSPEIKTFGNFVVVVERRDVENREAMEDPFEKRKF